MGKPEEVVVNVPPNFPSWEILLRDSENNVFLFSIGTFWGVKPEPWSRSRDWSLTVFPETRMPASFRWKSLWIDVSYQTPSTNTLVPSLLTAFEAWNGTSKVNCEVKWRERVHSPSIADGLPRPFGNQEHWCFLFAVIIYLPLKWTVLKPG